MLRHPNLLQHLRQLIPGIPTVLFIAVARDLCEHRRTQQGAAKNRRPPTASYCPPVLHAVSSILNPLRLAVTSPEQVPPCSRPRLCHSSASAPVLRSSQAHSRCEQSRTSAEAE